MYPTSLPRSSCPRFIACDLPGKQWTNFVQTFFFLRRYLVQVHTSLTCTYIRVNVRVLHTPFGDYMRAIISILILNSPVCTPLYISPLLFFIYAFPPPTSCTSSSSSPSSTNTLLLRCQWSTRLLHCVFNVTIAPNDCNKLGYGERLRQRWQRGSKTASNGSDGS